MIDLSFLKNNPGNIVFRNSGGPDSAILMYLTALYIKENDLDIKFYHISIDTTQKFFYIKYAKKLITFLEEEFGIVCEEHRTDVLEHVLDESGILIGYAEAQKYLATEMLKDHTDITYEFVGSSNMMDPEITMPVLREVTENKFYESGYTVDSSRTVDIKKRISQSSIGRTSRNTVLYEPFANMDKTHISQLYQEHNLIDKLLPLTRSCESGTSAGFYLGEQHCGKCLFCVERELVFGRL